MQKKALAIGIDIVSIKRFQPFIRKRQHPFLQKVFTKGELEYCFSYSAPAKHLAGTFAAKEAASKALGVVRYPFAELEIRRTKEGAPHVWKAGKRVRIAISITHADDVAAAVAVR